MATAITKKPTAKVTGLNTPSRVKDTWGWQIKWGVPAAAKSDKSNARATGVEVEWELGMGLNYKDKNGKWVIKNPRIIKTAGISWTDWLKCWLNAGWDWSNGFKNVTRQSFYPLTSRILYNIHARVRLTNGKGKGPEVHVYRALSVPTNPSIANPVHDEQTGRVSASISVDKSTADDVRECYDSEWRIKVVDTRVDGKERIVKSGTTTSASYSIWYDVADRQQLTYGQYVRVTFEVRARGLRGASAYVSKTKYVAYPGQGKITGVSVPATSAKAPVTVLCSSGATAQHPVTSVKLQALRSVSYETAEDIPSTATWDDTGAVDNGTVTALAVTVEDLRPDRGLRTWVRLKTIHEYESMFYRYSDPVQLSQLFVPAASAAEERVTIVSIVPDSSGESMAVTLGWNADGTDDADGTELTWAGHADAWRSNDGPASWSFDWSDGPITVGSVTYGDSAEVVVRGLEPGGQYWMRARRYKEGEAGTTYSPWSSIATAITGADAGDVALMAQPILPRGRSLALTWVLGEGPEQTAWEVLTGTAVTDGKVSEWAGDPSVVAAGEGPLCTCTIDAERIASIAGSASAIPISVRSLRGGEYAESAISIVALADAPALSMVVPETVTAQGPTLALSCSLAADVRITCSSMGAVGDSPDGMREQLAGDVVWSDAISPVWAGAGPFTYDVTLPTGLALWNNASYTVAAVARDPLTGLESELAEGAFTVAWAHPAPAPSEAVAVTPSDVTDEDGARSIQAMISLVAPEDAAEGDTYDVFRITPDGSYAIAVGQALDATVTDPYAPYGGEGMAYRVALTTADGDANWLDYPYELSAKELRIDFGDRYVELPWNIGISDSWRKDFESRAHLGAETPDGYWNESVERTAGLSTDVLRVGDPERIAALSALAQHAGPCFVRTPMGSAYEADVQVGGMERASNSGVCPVSLDATEVSLTADYMAIVSIPTDPDDPEEAEP